MHAPAGETATATMRLDRRAFASWNPAEHDWVVPDGTYGLWVGRSSRDLELAGDVAVHDAAGS